MTGRPNIVLCDAVGRDSCEGNAPFGPEKASRQLITRMNRTRMNRASCYADSDRPHRNAQPRGTQPDTRSGSRFPVAPEDLCRPTEDV